MRKAMPVTQDEARSRNAIIISMKRQSQLDLGQLKPGDLAVIQCSHGTVYIAILQSTHRSKTNPTAVNQVMVRVCSSRKLMKPSGRVFGSSPIEMFFPCFLKRGEEFFNMGEIEKSSLNGSTLF